MKNILKFVFMAIFGILVFNIPIKASAITLTTAEFFPYVTDISGQYICIGY